MRKKEIEKEIDRFELLFLNQFKDYNVDYFYENIKDLIIKSKHFTLYDFALFLLKDSVSNGNYDMRKNILRIKDLDIETNRKTITHELLHVSSRKDKDNTGFQSTFTHNGELITIGMGLNEGYTELLNCNYFQDEKIKRNCYEYEQIAACGLEKIFGTDVFRKLYFNADIFELIKLSSNYMNPEDFLEVLYRMDRFKYEYNSDKDKENLKRIKDIIGETYLNKINKELKNNIISEEEYITNKFLFHDLYLSKDILLAENTTIKKYEYGYIITGDYDTTYIDKEIIPEGVIIEEAKTRRLKHE